MKLALAIIFSSFSLFFLAQTAKASEKPTKADIVNITETGSATNSTQIQWLELVDAKNQSIFIKNTEQPLSKYNRYQIGEEIQIQKTDENAEYIITDYYRQSSLAILFWIFVAVVLIVGKFYGFSSLAGMAFSLFFIVKIILPQISSGVNPVLVVLSASIILIPVTFYLSHGINTKTNLAILGTLISAAITAILALIFTHLAHLNGFASEDASFLDIAKNGSINIQSLLISGIIIGSIGVLDDVSVSQVSVVKELSETNPNLTFAELFKKSMSVGRDHVASMVNTLFLVYTGAAMPLILLFMDNNMTFTEIINTQLISEEVVRTLVSSIGLILAVPTTTFMAAKFYTKSKN